MSTVYHSVCLFHLSFFNQCPIVFQVHSNSVQSLSRVRLYMTPWTAAHQASLSISNSWSLLKLMFISQWCHAASHALSSPSPGFNLSQHQGLFPMSQFFASGGQTTGASASGSDLLMNIQSWFPLGLTGLISLQSKGLSRVFSNTTDQKHQFFSTQLSLWSNSHINTWLLEKP